LLLRHEGAKRNTIGVTKKTNAKLPHHNDHVSAYSMENETPLAHHAVKW
jgi:hypothetical protein